MCLFRSVCFQFHLSYSDRQRYDIEDRPEGQQQILMDISRNLPVFCRSASGGTHIHSRTKCCEWVDLAPISFHTSKGSQVPSCHPCEW